VTGGSRRGRKAKTQKPQSMNENELSYKIIGVALQLHRNLGPGLLESAYEAALFHDLQEIGLTVRRQVGLPFIYKTINMEVGYRIDLLINEKVIIESKAIETLAPVHFAQVLTYLKLSNLKLALLINFNVKTLREHIHRIVNNL
jgi:GxxExxY protein